MGFRLSHQTLGRQEAENPSVWGERKKGAIAIQEFQARRTHKALPYTLPCGPHYLQKGASACISLRFWSASHREWVEYSNRAVKKKPLSENLQKRHLCVMLCVVMTPAKRDYVDKALGTQTRLN